MQHSKQTVVDRFGVGADLPPSLVLGGDGHVHGALAITYPFSQIPLAIALSDADTAMLGVDIFDGPRDGNPRVIPGAVRRRRSPRSAKPSSW